MKYISPKMNPFYVDNDEIYFIKNRYFIYEKYKYKKVKFLNKNSNNKINIIRKNKNNNRYNKIKNKKFRKIHQ